LRTNTSHPLSITPSFYVAQRANDAGAKADAYLVGWLFMPEVQSEISTRAKSPPTLP
jgi:hypothetical protein